MSAVKGWPAWRIVRELKRHGVRQVDVAQKVGVSISFVHDTIHRRKPAGHEKAEAVWAVIEEALA